MCYRKLIENHTQCIKWYHFQWPWVISDRVSRSQHFWSRISEKRRLLMTGLLFHTNRKLFLTYGMVLCLVTLTDLWTRRAGLSASAELLVRTICILSDNFELSHILCGCRMQRTQAANLIDILSSSVFSCHVYSLLLSYLYEESSREDWFLTAVNQAIFLACKYRSPKLRRWLFLFLSYFSFMYFHYYPYLFIMYTFFKLLVHIGL